LGLLLAPAALFPLSGRAQSNFTGAGNIVSQQELEWKHVSTDNIDVHFYGGSPFMAADVAHYAEEAIFDLSTKLDYKIRSRFALFLYMSPQDLIGSQRYPEPKMREGGFTPLRINSRNLLFNGSHGQLQNQTREAVAALLMEDFYYGGNLQHSIQNTVLLHLPRWFEEGFPAYMGEGWTYEDELWLSSLRTEKSLNDIDPLDFAIDGNEPINRVLRKSIWYYVADQHGENKLNEFFYMTRLTRSVESGVMLVTGKTMKTFTEDWRQFILKRIEDNNLDREPLTSLGKQVKLPARERMLSFALHPKEAKAAVWLERDGKSRLVVANLSNGSLQETQLSLGFPTDQLNAYLYEFPLAWSPDGTRIVTSFLEKGKHTLAFVEVGSGKVTRTQQLSRLVDHIYSLSWSHSGSEIVCSALVQGNIDLYTFKPTDQKYTRLTQDAYDDLSPVWDADDASILFATNHGDDTIPAEDAGYQAYSHDFDVYQLPLAGKEPMRQVARTPGINEMPVGMASSFELVTLSDQMGIRNLERLNIFQGQSALVTNVAQGFWRVNRTDTLLAWSAPEAGSLRLFYAGASVANEPKEVLVAPLRSQNEFFELQRRLLMENKIKPVAVPNNNNEAQPVGDTAEATPDTAQGGVRYYIFDEEEAKPRTKKRVTVRLGPAAIQPTAEVPDFADIKINGPSATKAIWSADEITTQIQWDPVFRLGMLFQARFTDQRGFHQFTVGYRPFFDFKSSDVHATFRWLKHRPDYYLGAYRESRSVTRSDFLLRYQTLGLKGGAIYPISRFASVGLEGHVNYIQRTDLNPFLPGLLDGKDLVAGATAHFTYSKLKTEEQFVKRGTWLQLQAQETYGLAQTQQYFVWGSVDARKYTPVLKNMVFASRLSSGFSLGPQRRHVFLGGANEWLFGRLDNVGDLPFNNNVSDFQYSTFVCPVRGFSWNARNGTQYVAANLELRIPFSRMMAEALNSNPAYSLEFIPFFDVGTVWTEGNPLSQRNPIDTETITGYPVSITVQTLKSPFVMGAGAGARLMVVGYSMRFDFAWGIEDQSLLKPRLYLTLGKDF
jgi:hypothetical protein